MFCLHVPAPGRDGASAGCAGVGSWDLVVRTGSDVGVGEMHIQEDVMERTPCVGGVAQGIGGGGLERPSDSGAGDLCGVEESHDRSFALPASCRLEMDGGLLFDGTSEGSHGHAGEQPGGHAGRFGHSGGGR